MPFSGTTDSDTAFLEPTRVKLRDDDRRLPKPQTRSLVLVGGGHAHVEVLRRMAERPWPRVEVLLVTPGRYTPYSGMLPGLIAGHYRFEEAHIDLAPLCRRADVTLVESEATGLDTGARTLFLGDGRRITYDVLSINTGSRPDLADVNGAAKVGLPVKPVEAFLRQWERMKERARRGTRLRVTVVGAGAAGVELVLAMQHAMGNETRTEFHLVTGTPGILPTHARPVRRILTRVLEQRGIILHCGRAVVAARRGELRLDDDRVLRVEEVIWTLAASPPSWISRSGLATDTRGFVAVSSRLQSLSHPEVFAAGDTATILEAPRPKAGVFAVRQGPPLTRNLLATLEGRSLTSHVPQRRALSLLSTGDRRAVASYGPLAVEGAWVWRWKDWIDRRFMARYRLT